MAKPSEAQHRSLSVSSLLNDDDQPPPVSSSAPPAPAPATEASRSHGLPAGVDPDSEAVRMAIHALGAMRQPRIHDASSSASTITATSTAVASPTTAASLQDAWPKEGGLVDEHFIDRVSQLPYVGGALRAYETGKNANRVVKVCLFHAFSFVLNNIVDHASFPQYGADFAESSVKTIADRVVGQETLGQLDAFGCRQLDRVSPSFARLTNCAFGGYTTAEAWLCLF
jgi:hypothetical protein